MNSKIKLALGYLWAIVSSIVFWVAVQSLAANGSDGAVIIGYATIIGYAIFRWNIVARKIVIKDKLLSGLIRGFVLLCAFFIFAGVSGFHGGSEEGKIFAAVIALVMAIEAVWQVKRLSILPNGQ